MASKCSQPAVASDQPAELCGFLVGEAKRVSKCLDPWVLDLVIRDVQLLESGLRENVRELYHGGLVEVVVGDVEADQ